MTRWQFLGQVLGAMALLAGSLGAQPPRRPGPGEPPGPPPPGGGDRQRDPFFDAMIDVHRETQNREFFELTDYPTIRSEVRLSDEDADKIEANNRLAIRKLFELRDESETRPRSKEELKEAIREVLSPYDEASYQVLREKSDFERLVGIYIQARHHRAVFNQEVAKRIHVEGKQLDELRQERSRFWRAFMRDSHKDLQDAIRHDKVRPGGGRREIATLFEQADRELDARVAKKLTPEQRESLRELKGAAFALPENLFQGPRSGARPSRGPRDDRERGPEGRRGEGEREDARRDADRQEK